MKNSKRKPQRSERDPEYKFYSYPVPLSGQEMIEEGRVRLAQEDFVFMSIDLEMFEKNSDIITEIGISILDMSSQANFWYPDIITYHLLPNETRRYMNGTRIADKRHLFAHGHTYAMDMWACKYFFRELVELLKLKSNYVCIIGHDVKSDLFLLNKNGFLFDQNLTVLDTHDMWAATCPTAPSLSNILETLRIDGKYMHNAGNDAYYTLKAAIHMVDPVVRSKLGLDLGPSYAEACRIAQEERKHSNDPDSLPASSASPELEDLEKETKKLEELTLKEKRIARAKRDTARSRRRLQETLEDMPSHYISITAPGDLIKELEQRLA